MIALSICWSCVCRSECLLFSKICSNSEAKQAQTKSNAPPRGDYDQGTGKQSDTWKSLERQRFLKFFRISFSGWIDNRNFALRCVVGRLASLSVLFRGEQASGRKKSQILGICCICNQIWTPTTTRFPENGRYLDYIQKSWLQIRFEFKLQRCIFILLRSSLKSKYFKHRFNPDVLIHLIQVLSFTKLPVVHCCKNCFCTVN